MKGKYCMRPLDQPMVKTESEFLRFLLWKQIYEGDSSPMPVIKQDGDTFKLNFCMQVEKIAMQGESLKIIAKYKPLGSQTTDWGWPPTSCWPTTVFVKSATGKASLGAEPAKHTKETKLVFYLKTNRFMF